MSCPCFDPITASPIQANVQDAYISAGPPEFAAFSRANALAKLIGGEQRLARIFEMGNRDPREVLTVGSWARCHRRQMPATPGSTIS
jgi:hypothetical protein